MSITSDSSNASKALDAFLICAIAYLGQPPTVVGIFLIALIVWMFIPKKA